MRPLLEYGQHLGKAGRALDPAPGLEQRVFGATRTDGLGDREQRPVMAVAEDAEQRHADVVIDGVIAPLAADHAATVKAEKEGQLAAAEIGAVLAMPEIRQP